MRYKPGHREETRDRIVTTAARRFRSDGYEAASVKDIMSDAGLTVGGFYAHFGSKEELFAEAIAAAGRQALADRSGIDAPTPEAWVGALVASYLNREHAEDRAGGCPLAGLGSEVARAGEQPRAAYRESMGCFVDVLAAHLDGSPARRKATAEAIVSMCVGALTLARAGLDEPAAAALFGSCRQAAQALAREAG